MKNITLIAGRNNPIAGRNESKQRKFCRLKPKQVIAGRNKFIAGRIEWRQSRVAEAGKFGTCCGPQQPYCGPQWVLKNSVLGIT